MVSRQTVKSDGEKLDLELLESLSRKFFLNFGTQKLLGRSFLKKVSTHNADSMFEALISACGYENDVPGFLIGLTQKVLYSKNREANFNGLDIPKLYLYELLKELVPGDQWHPVKTIAQLEKKTRVPAENPEKLQQVIDMYPVRLSDHVIRQSMVSEKVARQYLPFESELDSTGHVITFDGHFKNGLLEQMYQNRVVFLLDMHCPVYCRFCFRKHKSNRKENTPLKKDVMAAVEHVRKHSSIKEILITGGEPLLNRPNLEAAVNNLVFIDHVQTIRIATRSIAYYPELFLKNDREYIKYLIEKNRLCMQHNKDLEIGIHIVHPDELSIQTLDIISSLVKNGIKVYVQTPFLNKVNTNGEDLVKLFALLYQAGTKIYYIFTPCSPIHGTKEYWAPISSALDAGQYLRLNISDRCVPKLCTATPLGKIEWNTSGWAVEKDITDPSYTWIRTPYTKKYFDQFLSGARQIPEFRINSQGTLDARFRLDMGDDRLFKRNLHNRTPSEPDDIPLLKKQAQLSDIIRDWLKRSAAPRVSIVKDLPKSIVRFHRRSVQIDMDNTTSALKYIEENSELTDVVLCCDLDNPDQLVKTNNFVNRLKKLDHIISARICWKMLAFEPDRMSTELVDKIAGWQDCSVGSFFRVEIETWFFHPDQVQDRHGVVARGLSEKGINSYANVFLLKGVNDLPETMVSIAHCLRKAGIEFHHLYVAGLDIQKKLNQQQVTDSIIIDIASEIRVMCSGREIPLYIIQTLEGERDYTPGFNYYL